MASFNVESAFLDVKKNYQHFQYTHLMKSEVIEGQKDEKDIYEGMTQNTYLFVQEKTVLISDIQNISLYFRHKYSHPIQNINQDAFKKFPFEKVRDRVCFIFQKYQQQPTLLDTILQPLIQPLMNEVKQYLFLLMKNQQQKPVNDLHSLLQIVYQLSKVRGDKWVIQYFPHEVKDLYPALGYLARERNDSTGNWESRYVILLWLGVIALVPFNLDIIDSGIITIPSEEEGTQVTEIVELMIQIGKHYLKSLTKMREAAAVFLSKLFTRPDIQKRGVLPKYIKFALRKIKELSSNPMQNFFICGLYDSLCNIFKRVQRSELLPLMGEVLEQLNEERKNKTNSAKKQFIIKLLTRLGLTYLKPRVVTWAYRKKKQSLLSNLSTQKKNKLKSNTNQQFDAKTISSKQSNNLINSDNDTQYYRDVNKENLEDILDMLIEGLSEKQTSVREEASKGMGMIAGRLSQDMVLDIIDYILALHPSPQTQHALCLTLAQFIRRNLLSPEKLKQIYPLMSDSLLYEKEEGGYSVGQAVRDAACYMTWSVARGYQQGGKQLGISLMIAACFDREVGCRRAASAAYQELVGRVGDVPNGIQVLTEADYFTLGPQKNAYLNVAIFVSSFEPYFKPFAEYICHQKLRHWDIQIKRIAACSLSLMSCHNPTFIAKEILSAMANYLNADSMTVKLGTIIGLSEALLGLKGFSHLHQLHNEMKDSVFLKSMTQNEKKLLKAGEYMEQFKDKHDKARYIDNSGLIPKETVVQIIQNLKSKIKQGKVYKGKAGENFRIYTCRLLEVFAMCEIPLEKQDIQIFKEFIQQNIKNPQEPIFFAAVKSLKAFLKNYHDINDKKYINNMINMAKNSKQYSKCYTLALSKFNRQIYLTHQTEIIQVLDENCKITKQNNDPERRKYAIMALQAMALSLGFDCDKFTTQDIENVFKILFRTVEDYTMDKRGDIGSIVRQQSMTTFINIIQTYCSSTEKKRKISNQIVTQIIGKILQQLNEKIDRIRLLAGSLLQTFFDHYQSHFSIPHQQILIGIFGQQNIRKLIKQSEEKIDLNLQTQVIKMQMKIQQTLLQEESRQLIYFWNLPHCVFPLTVPMLKFSAYSFFILKGLCTSTGGISQSIIKFSLQELGNYITFAFKQGEQKGELMDNLMKDILRLMKDNYKDQRVIVPLYKTLDFILEREEAITWNGLKKFDTELFYLIQKELSKTKSIAKVSAATGLYVSLLGLNNEETKKGIMQSVVRILCSDLPKARKILADKLLLYLMSQEQCTIFNQQQTEFMINIVSENDFVDEKLDVEILKVQIMANLGLQ